MIAAHPEANFAMLDILRELWAFLRVRKKYWLMPIVLVLVAIGGILVAVKGSVIAPFIYTLF
jgi:hydrogenase/urease accessory protein HupE